MVENICYKVRFGIQSILGIIAFTLLFIGAWIEFTVAYCTGLINDFDQLPLDKGSTFTTMITTDYLPLLIIISAMLILVMTLIGKWKWLLITSLISLVVFTGICLYLIRVPSMWCYIYPATGFWLTISGCILGIVGGIVGIYKEKGD